MPGGFRPGRGGFGGGHGFGGPVEKPKDLKGTLRRLAVYLRPMWPRLAVVFLAAVGSTALSVVSPKVMGKAVTSLGRTFGMRLMGLPAGVDFPYIGRIVLWLAGLYTASSLLNYVTQYVMAGVAQRTVCDMRRDLSDKFARLPLRFFDGRTHGEIMSRMTNDIDTIGMTLQQTLGQLITASIGIVGAIVMMFSISWLLTLICLVTLPLAFFVTATIARTSQRNFAAQQMELGLLNGHVEEMYTGHKIVKAFGHESKAIDRFNQINERLYNAAWRAHFVSGMIFPLMNFMNNIGYVLICAIGGVMVTRRAIELGDITAFLQYQRMFTMPIGQTANIVNILQSTVASAERVFELLDETEEVPDTRDAAAIASPRGEVRFENVRFSYKRDVPLIEDLSIEVKPGQTIAIVGPTGAGKTTLVNLLMRFYDVDAGRITIDGVDIRDLNRGELRKLFGMVLQDTWLFHGTIRDNIAYGREGATDEEIVRAAKAAQADHFIRALPDGYDTVLDEDASNLSQGERQLVTIARALLADPAILILDEATSSVDTRTETYIQKAMAELMRGRTSFVIAHRLSTIRNAELILVMNNGRIIETGAHEQLLAMGGFYADLYNSQFRGAYADDLAV
ncbi:MAG: ABC transporter ATP-binding protein/permease [Firmicutes bacterium]|nr:ABC transporter ATP-binding protein/permease [Bacillota bacterium]MDH7495473.1 ABC transporter ATP-binding protein [Bacillota bacterium]